MSLMDVELSEDAIQEDEALIEAVEQLMETAAVSIKSEILKEVEQWQLKALKTVEALFPILLEYQQDEARFWEDMQNLALFGVLVIVSFFVLAPTSRTRRKSFSRLRSGKLATFFGQKYHSELVGKRRVRHKIYHSRTDLSHSDSSLNDEEENTTISSTSLCKGRVVIEEESNEERFEKDYPFIKVSAYHRLVLPPNCKLVDSPKQLSSTKEEKKSKEIGDITKSESDDDNPARRLQTYLRHFLHLMKSFISYDYVSAGWTLINWLQVCLRRRQNHLAHAQHPDMEDEDIDDDSSRASHTSRTSHTSRRSTRHAFLPVVPKTPPISQEVSEEKKEVMENSPVLAELPNLRPERKASDCSIYETPLDMDDEGEADVGEAMTSVRLPYGKPKRTIGKRRDALENYRLPSANSMFLGPSPITPNPLSPLPDAANVSGNLSSNTSANAEASAGDQALESKQSLNTESSEYSAFFFETAHSRSLLRRMVVESPVPDKNGYILGDEFLPEPDYTPLLVFVNSRSGPQQGHFLITQLRRLLNPIQVWDLADGGPEKVLDSFASQLKNLRILVCGGDGTVSWIISTLEKLNLNRKWPPIAILPLGTGNDLARIHGWGGGYSNESLIGILEQVQDSYISLLDRWEMTVENRKGKVKSSKSFFNYLGVGADAQAALQVHMLRETTPQLFFSRVVNKAWYGVFGAEDIIKATSANLPQEITLVADGVEVPLPHDSQGIILLNIDSYAGGAPMWATGHKSGFSGADSPRGSNENLRYHLDGPGGGWRRSKSMVDLRYHRGSNSLGPSDSVEDLRQLWSEEERFAQVTACDQPSSCQDGVLEIVSIRGAFHLGQIRVGLSTAQRLCSCREATITIKRKVAVQIDGEPWRQDVCVLRIKRKKESAYMLHRSADETGGMETEMANLLDWAEETRIIDGVVHRKLMKEFSRRIESKTRQRRGKSKENSNFFSTFRAMSTTASQPNFQAQNRSFS